MSSHRTPACYRKPSKLIILDTLPPLLRGVIACLLAYLIAAFKARLTGQRVHLPWVGAPTLSTFFPVTSRPSSEGKQEHQDRSSRVTRNTCAVRTRCPKAISHQWHVTGASRAANATSRHLEGVCSHSKQCSFYLYNSINIKQLIKSAIDNLVKG